MKDETKRTITRTIKLLYQLCWWVMVLIYVYAYLNFMPLSSFGSSQFNLYLFYVNLFTGMYLILKTGDLI